MTAMCHRCPDVFLRYLAYMPKAPLLPDKRVAVRLLLLP